MMKEEIEDGLKGVQRRLNDLREETSQVSSAIERGLKSLDEEAKKFLEEYGKLLDETTQVDSEIEKTNSEISALEQRISELKKQETELENKKREIETNNDEQSSEILSLKTQMSNLESELADSEKRLESLNSEIKELSSKLLEAEREHKKKVGVYIDEAQKIEDQNKRERMKARVLKHLLDTKYVTDPVYEILKSIGQPGIDNAKKLSLSANAQEQVAVQVLKELHEREIVSFDEGSGSFTVLKKMEDL